MFENSILHALNLQDCRQVVGHATPDYRLAVREERSVKIHGIWVYGAVEFTTICPEDFGIPF